MTFRTQTLEGKLKELCVSMGEDAGFAEQDALRLLEIVESADFIDDDSIEAGSLDRIKSVADELQQMIESLTSLKDDFDELVSQAE